MSQITIIGFSCVATTLAIEMNNLSINNKDPVNNELESKQFLITGYEEMIPYNGDAILFDNATLFNTQDREQDPDLTTTFYGIEKENLILTLLNSASGPV